MKLSQEWWNFRVFGDLKNEASGAILNQLSLSMSCWRIPDKREFH